MDDHAMAMGETIVAAVSGVSGAGIGALAALLVQRAKRRDDADAAEIAVNRAQGEVQLEIRATARATARAWLTCADRVISDLEHGRTPEAQRSEELLEAELKELTTALYRFTGREHALLPIAPPSPESPRRPSLPERATDVSHRLREAVHGGTDASLSRGEAEAVRTEVRLTYDAINHYLVGNLRISSSISAMVVNIAPAALRDARQEGGQGPRHE
ncbi:hypothetical protein [Streptomyces sp. NPDC058579]|uniref:hypothetical protein n=1 Tax=Streptomyces sp. NPDC058579 TaxID=3346548 RepID=UPI00365D8A17